MSSLLRRIQRKQLRDNGKYINKTMPTITEQNGYKVYHPTRGYRTVSYKRAALYV